MKKTGQPSAVYDRIKQILEAARTGISRTVNTTQVLANWLIGREIVEEEQSGRDFARYGQKVIARLAERLRNDFGEGSSVTNLKLFRQFYLSYPVLIERNISHTMRDQFKLAPTSNKDSPANEEISHTVCDQLESWCKTGETA